MAWLTLNGINLGAIASAGSGGKEPRRDIGDASPAADGTLRVTRVTRKRDIGFDTVPLLGTDAFAWECFLVGEGEHWSFDSNGGVPGLYGSKGLGPTGTLNALQTAGTPKFGNGVLRVNGSTGTITYAAAAVGSWGVFNAWTVMVWRFESSVWHHYVVTSAGKKWLDGVRNDATSTTWLSVNGSGDVVITNSLVPAQDYDDLVVLPYLVLDAWPPIFGVATSAFSDLPFLTAAGLLVPETATRRMKAQVTPSVLKSSKGADTRRLSVELLAA